MHQSTLFFFAAFVTDFLKKRAWRLWDFTVFPLCVASLCVGTSMGFYDFFPVGGPLCVRTLRFYGFFAVCGAPVSGDFEILRFFTCVCGPCVWGLWDFTLLFTCVWGPCVYGDFEILRLWDFTGLWDFSFFPCVWALCWRLWKFKKKISNREKFRCGDLKWQ